MSVRKGVIVAAGYGTRFLPVTRVVPKELLPIIDRPAIDLVVQEFLEAGITDLLVITSRRKKALEDWFDRDPELEQALGDDPRIRPPALRVMFARQQKMQGTGDAILLAREFAGRDPVVVAYPDDLFGEPNPTRALIASFERTGRSMLAATELEGDVSRYGVLDVVSDGADLVLKRFVEKPAPGTEPSKLVSWGRFVFDSTLFDALAELRKAHTTGEFFHVGAIEQLARQGKVGVEVITAERYDTGVPLGYLKTVIAHALARPDLGPELRAWLASNVV